MLTLKLALKEVFMKAVDRQKVCPNCSGKIPLDVSQCPYCFAQVPVDSSKETASFKNASLQESFSSKYAPPYQPKTNLTSNFLVNEEKKFFSGQSMSTDDDILSEKPLSQDAKTEGASKIFWPMLALSLGGNLFVLGVLQFFFSDKGVVKLEINAAYWFLFLLISLPLFYFGLKKLRGLAEE